MKFQACQILVMMQTMDNNNKVKYRDLSWPLQMGVVGGACYFVVVILLFVLFVVNFIGGAI